ncbi:hypothetical protein [Marinirhabdus gelatinilytica]|uniref:Outer membrane protein with beta-barrel domain n=1 Tax=Marinirhabdus gelatinilytica TaxID=1703343 RepID=A0A370QAR7_9FLAO|nr:hypothetical protein [Marinirhabdus gelatinilytica]RDK85471.1 hypothetical protein C8D94_103298 [Marinirhabdus gelatinilytica]
MKNRYRLLMVALLCTITVLAQRNAPVAGHAAQLTNLLKKDYSRLDPVTINITINQDRATVIGIIKNYIKEDTLLSKVNVKEKKDSIDDLRLEIKAQENKITQLTRKQVENNKDVLNQIKEERDSLLTNLNLIDSLLWDIHKTEMVKLQAIFKDNPYLVHLIELFIKKYNNIASKKLDTWAKENSFASIPKNLSFLTGDLAFGTLIDGMSKFLIKRAKEELTVYILEETEKKLSAAERDTLNILNELMLVMPKTSEYLKNFQPDVYSQETLNDVKQYVNADIEQLLHNIPRLEESLRFKGIINGNESLKICFQALRLIPQLSKVEHPIDYYEILKNNLLLSEYQIDREIVDILETAAMLTYSLTAIDGNQTKLVTTKFITTYSQEEHFLMGYIGLLNQQHLKYFNIEYKNSVKEIMDTIPPNKLEEKKIEIQNIVRTIFKIVENAERLYQNASEIKQKSEESEEQISPEVVYQYIEDFLVMFEDAKKASIYLIEIKNGRVASIYQNSFSNFFKTARITNEIALDLQRKRYAKAIISAIKIPLSLNNSNNENIRGYETTYKLINFYDDLANATDAESAEKAIEAFVLPRGSYKMKRKFITPIMLNAYPGFLGGIELSNVENNKTSGYVGITAPVGISLGLGKFGLFTSIIDIAAPTRLRLDSSKDTKTLSDYTFNNIFAPGLYFTYSFGNSPLVLYVGAQYGPELGFTEDLNGNIATTNTEVFRIGAGVTVDIPLLTLYRKPKQFKTLKANSNKEQLRILRKEKKRIEKSIERLKDETQKN